MNARMSGGRNGNVWGLIAVFSLLLGPVWLLVSAPMFHGALVFGDVGVEFPESLVQAFSLAVIPGFAIGAVYSVLPAKFQRIVCAPLLWCVPVALIFVWENWLFALAFGLLGGAAVAICAAVARILHFDIRGASRG